MYKRLSNKLWIQVGMGYQNWHDPPILYNDVVHGIDALHFPFRTMQDKLKHKKKKNVQKNNVNIRLTTILLTNARRPIQNGGKQKSNHLYRKTQLWNNRKNAITEQFWSIFLILFLFAIIFFSPDWMAKYKW